MSKSPLLVTGCAGFIGFHVCQRLLRERVPVVGVDNFSDYYDPQLKRDRLSQLLDQGLVFQTLDLSHKEATEQLFDQHKFGRVVHLAAQAGVRHSKTHPHAYTSANLEGFLNILEGCRHHQMEHLVYASSSSVYGANQKLPFSTRDKVDRPVSLYGATKKANELMAHSYAWMYGLPTTGLRFFTVYGPWGRPDMALYLFARAILEDQPIELFNYGKMQRDFTYIDDVVEGIVRLLPKPPKAAEQQAPAQIFNIGNHSPVELGEFLRVIEENLGKKAQVQLSPLQSGDVVATYADIADLEAYAGFRPDTPLERGIQQSISWYLDYRRRRGL
jgi:UDP-glucuronate 4-epimerase